MKKLSNHSLFLSHLDAIKCAKICCNFIVEVVACYCLEISATQREIDSLVDVMLDTYSTTVIITIMI